MKKTSAQRIILIVLTLLLMIPLTVSANGKSGEPNVPPNENNNKPDLDYQGEPMDFQNASVHDPSIIKADGMYYVFGTHIAAAKSDDLINWTNFTNGYTRNDNTLYGDLSENLSGSFEWAGENDADTRGGFGVWAPDIFWNEDYVNEDGTIGAYMIYYSVSSTWQRSAIGYAVSKDIEGPYEYVDTIVYSGFTNVEAYDDNSNVNKQWENTNISDLIEDDVFDEPNPDWFQSDSVYNTRLYPNAIDANMFYDEDGTLWMTYGSWSGGIYMYELDKSTGQPIYPGEDGTTEDGRMIDRYFGTKIAGGFGHSVEGPYAYYDDELDYYYLYLTYGGLSATGGYQMRVFRSKSPTGPYVDAAGEPAVLPDSLDDGEVGNKVDSYAHSDFGNKLMGNFMFERKIGDPGLGIGHTYTAPGHNSVHYDSDTGERFAVFHTRFPNRGESHEVRVHQLFMNKDGWPVATPFRYSGETLDKVNRQDIVGEYKFVNHGREITGDITNSVFVTLNKDNTVSGDVTGTWKKTGHNKAELTIDGKTYDGVFLRQYDTSSELTVMTFTAMSNEGVAVWGTKTLDRTAEEVIEAVVNDLDFGDLDSVISDLILPTEGAQNTVISWETSDPRVVTDTGEVTRPAIGEEDATTTLTATITKDGTTITKTFDITVLAFLPAGLTAHYAFESTLEDSTENFATGTITGNRMNNTGGTITYTDGVRGEAAVFNGDSGVRLPDGLISSHSYSVSLWLKPENLSAYTTAFFGARTNSSWVSLLPGGNGNGQTMVWSGSQRWVDSTTSRTIPIDQWSHVVFTVDEGNIKIYIDGVLQHDGNNFPNIFTTTNGNFSLAVNWWDTPFKGLMDELRVYEGALSQEEILELAQK